MFQMCRALPPPPVMGAAELDAYEAQCRAMGAQPYWTTREEHLAAVRARNPVEFARLYGDGGTQV